MQNKYVKLIILALCVGLSCGREIFSPAEKTILNQQNSKDLSLEFVEEYAHSTAPVKKRLILACANSRNKDFLPILQTIYNQSEPEVRELVAFALSQFDDSAAGLFLLEQLPQEKNEKVREQLLLSLGKIGQQDDLEIVIDNFSKMKVDTIVLVKALGYYFDRDLFHSDFIQLCCEKLESSKDSLVFEAATTLSRVERLVVLQKCAAEVVASYQRSAICTRLKLIKILCRIDFPRKCEFFASVLDQGDKFVKIEALENLKYVENCESMLANILKNSSDKQVLAAALKNIPVDDKVIKKMAENIVDIAKHTKSIHVKGLAVQNLMTLNPQKYADIVAFDEGLVPYQIEGWTNSKSSAAIAQLYKYSHHNSPQIATPAYKNLLYLTKYFVQNEKMEQAKLFEYINFGLESFDPVKITLAAQQVRRLDLHYDIAIKKKIYDKIPFLLKSKNTEALLEVIETIEYLLPQDAVEKLWALSRCNIYQVSQKAQRVLTSLYNIQTETSDGIDYKPPGGRNLGALNKYGLQTEVQIKTEKGDFTLQVEGHNCPYSYATFLKLVEAGFYNGLDFHRVVPNFVVQGGDPRGDGWGGIDYNLLTEIAKPSFRKGTVGLARSELNTEGSQFFITTSYQPHLDYDYTYLGKVIQGMEIVQKIEPSDKIIAAEIIE